MQVRTEPDPTSTQLLALSSGSGITFLSMQAPGGPAAPSFNNAFSITVTKAQSLGLAAGNYYYDCFIDWPNGTSSLYMQGRFDVLLTVTR